MQSKIIRSVTPEKNHVLRVEFDTGSVLLLDMSSRLEGLRLRPLRRAAVWNSAVTNGTYVRWRDVELSWDELLAMACEKPDV